MFGAVLARDGRRCAEPDVNAAFGIPSTGNCGARWGWDDGSGSAARPAAQHVGTHSSPICITSQPVMTQKINLSTHPSCGARRYRARSHDDDEHIDDDVTNRHLN